MGELRGAILGFEGLRVERRVRCRSGLLVPEMAVDLEMNLSMVRDEYLS
jgi:hypothetical protein